ncbi:MAG: hypothetical protein WDA74_01725 [Spirochaetota bacterium]
MKKLSVFLILAIAAFAFVGCSDEGTGLRWKNGNFDNSNDQYEAIMWVDDVRSVGNQTWNEVPEHKSSNPFTDYKEVTALNGHGEVLASSGDPVGFNIELASSDSDQAGVALSLPGSNSVQLEKGADATLVIENILTK